MAGVPPLLVSTTLRWSSRGRGSSPELFGCRAAKGTGHTCGGDAQSLDFSRVPEVEFVDSWTPCELYLLDSIRLETGASE